MKVTKVTCQDKVTIAPADGYTMPSDYDSYIPVTAHSSAGSFTYTLTGDTVFPGVVKITPGDHTKADGSTDAFCVSSAKAITLSSVTGYKLPEDYSEKVQSLAGVTKSGTKYLFAQDAELPSVYKVEFKGYEDKNEGYVCVCDSTIFDTIETKTPTHATQIFDRWDYSGVIHSDIVVKSIWNPCYYNMTLGSNIQYSFDGINFKTSTTPVSVSADVLVVLTHSGSNTVFPENYFSTDVEMNGSSTNSFYLTDDHEFKSVYRISYGFDHTYKSFYFTEGSHVPVYNADSPELVNVGFFCDKSPLKIT